MSNCICWYSSLREKLIGSVDKVLSFTFKVVFVGHFCTDRCYLLDCELFWFSNKIYQCLNNSGLFWDEDRRSNKEYLDLCKLDQPSQDKSEFRWKTLQLVIIGKFSILEPVLVCRLK